MPMELRTQLEAAKESLLYLQKKIEGELAVKLLEKNSVVDELDIHVRNSKVQFSEITEQLMALNKWKESLADYNVSFIGDVKRHINNTVSKAELTKYSEQQHAFVESKLAECRAEIKDLQEHVPNKEKQMEMAASVNELRRLFEFEVKDNIKAIVKEEMMTDLKKVKDEFNKSSGEKLNNIQAELENVKDECARLTKENQKLNNELSKALSAIEELRNGYSENLEAEFLENINDLKAVVNATVERENSTIRRVTELEEKIEESSNAPMQTLANKLEVIEKEQKRVNNQYCFVTEAINALRLDMQRLTNVSQEKGVSIVEEPVIEKKNSSKDTSNPNIDKDKKNDHAHQESVHNEDFKDSIKHSESLLENFDEAKDQSKDVRASNKNLSGFLENLPDAEDTFESPDNFPVEPETNSELRSGKAAEENSFFSGEEHDAKDDEWFA
eukprot:TRINITY_DN12810_c0_g1_i8.p1 TRINITY_DN12810_c0_g1~~TRINITY_DN12810_c0_g1_i8.p1  ORF type:complete len:443 (+),score=105.70 TRINITY_DN12810_c0_g1_i8:365-1693(+)